MYGQKFEEGLNYLYRSINQLAMFPNRYWNSDYGLAGAANTFRLLLLMCPKNIWNYIERFIHMIIYI